MSALVDAVGAVTDAKEGGDAAGAVGAASAVAAFGIGANKVSEDVHLKTKEDLEAEKAADHKEVVIETVESRTAHFDAIIAKTAVAGGDDDEADDEAGDEPGSEGEEGEEEPKKPEPPKIPKYRDQNGQEIARINIRGLPKFGWVHDPWADDKTARLIPVEHLDPSKKEKKEKLAGMEDATFGPSEKRGEGDDVYMMGGCIQTTTKDPDGPVRCFGCMWRDRVELPFGLFWKMTALVLVRLLFFLHMGAFIGYLVGLLVYATGGNSGSDADQSKKALPFMLVGSMCGVVMGSLLVVSTWSGKMLLLTQLGITPAVGVVFCWWLVWAFAEEPSTDTYEQFTFIGLVGGLVLAFASAAPDKLKSWSLIILFWMAAYLLWWVEREAKVDNMLTGVWWELILVAPPYGCTLLLLARDHMYEVEPQPTVIGQLFNAILPSQAIFYLLGGILVSGFVYGYACGAILADQHAWWSALIGSGLALVVLGPMAWLSLKLEKWQPPLEPEPNPDDDWNGAFVQSNEDGTTVELKQEEQVKFVNPLENESDDEEEEQLPAGLTKMEQIRWKQEQAMKKTAAAEEGKME